MIGSECGIFTWHDRQEHWFLSFSNRDAISEPGAFGRQNQLDSINRVLNLSIQDEGHCIRSEHFFAAVLERAHRYKRPSASVLPAGTRENRVFYYVISRLPGRVIRSSTEAREPEKHAGSKSSIPVLRQQCN